MVTNALATSNPIKNKQLASNEKFCGQAGCERSFKKMLELAKNGSPRAKMVTGLLYLKGIGTDKNEQKAGRYLLASARAGLKVSQYVVGLLYLHGSGFEYDLDKGKLWLNKAAEAGYYPAIKLIRKNNNAGDEESARKLIENIPAFQDDGHIVITREYLTLDDWADYIKKNTLFSRRKSTGSRIRGVHCGVNCKTVSMKTLQGQLSLLRALMQF